MTNEFSKIDADSVEITSKQKVFKKDLISEKETLEARIVVLNQMLEALNKQ
jgi:hypothetical protein